MKHWWRSKTIWFNLIITILSAMETAFPIIQSTLPVNIHGVLLFILTVGNVALRFISTQTIVDRRKQDETPPKERRQ